MGCIFSLEANIWQADFLTVKHLHWRLKHFYFKFMVAFHKVGIFTIVSITLNSASVFCFEAKSLLVGGNVHFGTFGNGFGDRKKVFWVQIEKMNIL